MRYFGTLGAVCGKQSPRELIRRWADVRADSRAAPRREQDRGAIYEYAQDSGGFDCGSGDILRRGWSAAAGEGGAGCGDKVGSGEAGAPSSAAGSVQSGFANDGYAAGL